MTQKISLGDIPYKEINIIITPLFYQIGALILKIFGDSLFVYKLYGAAIMASLMVMFYLVSLEFSDNKLINTAVLFGITLLIKIIYNTSYNILVLVFLLIALLFELKRIKNEKKNLYNILIGLSLALAFFTKQTVGGVAFALSIIFLIIETLFFKERHLFKSILLRGIGFSIVFIPYLIWLIVTGALYNFIDFAFLGMLDFAQKNSSGHAFNLLMYWNFICILSGFVAGLNRKIKDKGLVLLALYGLANIVMLLPLVNVYHQLISTVIPTLIGLRLINIVNDFGYSKMAKCSVFMLFGIMLYGMFIIAKDKYKLTLEIWSVVHVVILAGIIISIIYYFWRNKSKDCLLLISAFLIVNAIYNIALWSLLVVYENVPEGLEVYKYCGYDLGDYTDIYAINNYIKLKEGQGFNVYIMSADASKYMVPLKRNNFKYDLLLQGNLGYKGEERVVEEIKLIENPLIFKREKLIFQESKIVDKFIKSNFVKLTHIKGFDVYRQKK
jgi:4-amino-4-deoxy-L-arabinose transferase-like glycosyltransferase